jgi:hypothetical protein
MQKYILCCAFVIVNSMVLDFPQNLRNINNNLFIYLPFFIQLNRFVNYFVPNINQSHRR